MIHAQVDVELRDHDRIMADELRDVPEEFRPEARAAMLGLFTWCLLHGQAKRLDDRGAISRNVVHCALGGGQERTARRLASSGLLEEVDGCYLIRNYVRKNRTRDQIEKSIAGAVERKRRSRSGHTQVTRDAGVPSGSGSGSGSLSGSDSLSPEGVQGDPETPRAAFVAEASAPPDDIPVTEAIEAACVMAGAPKPTRDHVQAMLADRRTRGRGSHDWTAEIVRWMQRERQIEARARGRGSGRALVQAAPSTGRLWKTGEEK